jgi:hypothetical protein
MPVRIILRKLDGRMDSDARGVDIRELGLFVLEKSWIARDAEQRLA